MRIAVDARPLRFPHTGIGKYTGKLLTRLSKKPGTQWFLYGVPADFETWDEGSVIVRQLSTRRFLSTPQAFLIMGYWARQDRADVFWSPRHHLPNILPPIPAVITIHDLVWRHVPNMMPHLNWLSERCLMPRSLERSTVIVVPSEFTRLDIQRYYPHVASKITVVPLGGDLSEPSTRSLVEGQHALFVGGLQKRKNLYSVVAAIAKLKRRGVLIKLLVVGSPPRPSDPIHRLMHGEGVDGQITFAPNLNDAEMAAAYRDCRFLVAPYLWEGFGLPVVEAAQFGKPSIVTECSALAEVANGAALEVSPTDPEQIAAAMLELCTSQESYARLANAALHIGERYRWSTAASRTLEIFQEALQVHRAG